MSITVFVADDHAIVRDGLRSLLIAQGDIDVIGDAANGRDAVRLVGQLHPDIAIIDIAMPLLNGIDATRQIRELWPSTHVIMLSMYSTSEHVFGALEAGARGYLLKESAGTELVNAIRAVYIGHRYLSEKITDQVIAGYVRQQAVSTEGKPVKRLSNREREILQLTVESRSTAEIAALLSLTPKTVETYRSRLMRKLEVDDVPGLMKFAAEPTNQVSASAQ